MDETTPAPDDKTPSLRALQKLVAHEPDRHPLVIALAAPLGSRLDFVLDQLRDSLRHFDYEMQEVTLSKLLDEVPAAPWPKLPARGEAGYYEARMGAGDALREKTGSGATLAGLAVKQVATYRESKPDTTVYVLRSLKHPDEAELLRHVYGDAFWLLAVVSDPTERREDFAEHLSGSGATFNDLRREADRLIARDEDDESSRHGQHVASVFQQADYYLPIRRGYSCRDEVDRFLDGVFGKPFMTPFGIEEAMRLSFAAALRSAAVGRQVGATLVPRDGSVYVTGTNEVPKPGGGQFWAGDEPDHRDFQSGYDPNPMWTNLMLEELFDRLSKRGWLRENLDGQSGNQLLSRAKQERDDKGDSLLSGIRANSITEFTRCLHAEQAAIVNSALQGISTRGAVLVTTTYPCHECAKFIVGAGIRAVVFIEPYPKSLVRQLYRDLIDPRPPMQPSADLQSLSDASMGKVPFLPFVGFSPTRYDQVFRAGERREGVRVVDFAKMTACPRGDGWNEPAIEAREAQAVTASMRLIAETFAPNATAELPTADTAPKVDATTSRGTGRRRKQTAARQDATLIEGGAAESQPPDDSTEPNSATSA